MSQKVYYYNKKINVLLSRKEIKDRIETLKETNMLFHKYEYVELNEWSAYLNEKNELKRPMVKTYEYSLHEIPLHDDWETIVIDDDLTLDLSDYTQLFEMSHGHISANLGKKLIENIHKLRDYDYKGIIFY